ncbi:MAG: PilZ domain-containing protein [Acidobacteria bacterium]|nr:PilZ domain-containing protein [Acidobacteriota bacterium]
MKNENPETRAKTRKTMRSVKLPDRSFKVRFKIFRFGFTDFDVFVRHFTEATSWKIESLNERTHTYTFYNGWNITLHPHGDISLYSPLLEREQAIDVYGVIDVLLALDVRVGENCEVEMHYEGDFGGRNGLHFLSGGPIVLLAGMALVLFLGTKTAQMMYHRILSAPVIAFFETACFLFAVAFAYFLYKGLNRNKESFEEVLLEASQTKSHEEFMRNEDVRRKQGDTASIHARDLMKELTYPLENIMAYTRFYKSHTQPDTQHWKDLMEIMDQATRIREVMNRVEARLIADGDEPAGDASKKLFRKTQRRLDLIPVIMRGTDLLGDAFETPSYTLNISATGVSLLLLDGLVAVGQSVDLDSKEFSMRGTVRWVVAGKTGNMMLAGVEFHAFTAQDASPPQPEEASTPAATDELGDVPVAARG